MGYMDIDWGWMQVRTKRGGNVGDDTTEDDSTANQRISPVTIMMRNDYKRSMLACMEIDRREGKRRERIEGIWNNKKNKRGN